MTGVVLDMSVIEAATLGDLVAQFAELLAETEDAEARDDPAIARLVPDAYRGDAEAAEEFRRLTQNDLLDRRRADAQAVAVTLHRDGVPLRPREVSEDEAADPFEVHLDEADVAAWLRTLTALRLVLATRLGIRGDADDLSHPRFGVYNWLGYRLEGLLDAVDR